MQTNQTKLTDHVVSLKWAQKLKEAGYSQEGCFYWVQTKLAVLSPAEWELSSIAPIEKYGALSPFEWCVAPLASELGEQLPRELNYQGIKYWHYSWPFGKDGWATRYAQVGTESYVGSLNDTFGNSMADSYAKMYLYLKSESLL